MPAPIVSKQPDCRTDTSKSHSSSPREMDPNFDTSNLPDDFPSNLVPDSFTGGMYAELGSVRNVNFESSSSFDDVVAVYTDKIGHEPTIVEGEERLAQWPVDVWAVSVIEGTPTLIGINTSS